MHFWTCCRKDEREIQDPLRRRGPPPQQAWVAGSVVPRGNPPRFVACCPLTPPSPRVRRAVRGKFPCNDDLCGTRRRRVKSSCADLIRVFTPLSRLPQRDRDGNRAARSRRGRGSRAAGRWDCPTGPRRTARAGPAPPVPPVLSGRDQASPTPPMTIPTPSGFDDKRETTSPDGIQAPRTNRVLKSELIHCYNST